MTTTGPIADDCQIPAPSHQEGDRWASVSMPEIEVHTVEGTYRLRVIDKATGEVLAEDGLTPIAIACAALIARGEAPNGPVRVVAAWRQDDKTRVIPRMIEQARQWSRWPFSEVAVGLGEGREVKVKRTP